MRPTRRNWGSGAPAPRPWLWGMAVVAMCAIVGSIAPSRVQALHTKTPPVLQVTRAPGQMVGSPHFSIGHNILVFHSDGDLLGNGNTIPQIFLFEMSARVTGKKRLGLFQMTFGDQPSMAPSAAARGRVLAFHSTDDPKNSGSVGRQIFASRKIRWRKADFPFLQITRGSNESFDPVVTQTGRYVFFSSTGNLSNEVLLPGTHLYRAEIRKFEKSKCPGFPCPLGNPGLKLISPVPASHPAPNQNGTKVVFESTGDAAGNGCVNGATQLFLHDFVTGVTEQLTFGAGDSRNPVFTIDSKTVLFDSSADLTQSGNAVRNIFAINLDADPDLFGGKHPITQITAGTDGDTYEPAPSGPGGRRVFIKSTAGHANSTPGTENLFIYDLGTLQYLRLTNGDPLLSNITSQFTFTAFASTSDFTGENPTNGAQIFLVNAFPLIDPLPPGTKPTPVPTPRPTATPVAGQPANIGFALVVDEAADNGNNTLTTLLAATVGDFFGNPVADGTPVSFSIIPETAGLLISNGTTGTDPTCDISRFEEKTGVTVVNRVGVVHVCVTYPGGLAGTTHSIKAVSGPSLCVDGSNAGLACTHDEECPPVSRCSVSNTICTVEQDCPLAEACIAHLGHCEPTATEVGEFKLPLPHNDCTVNGAPCSDFNPCTGTVVNPDTCGGGLTTKACVGGTRDGLVCTTDGQCPSARRCFGGANHGGACADQFDCPPLAAGGDPGECRLQTTGACQLTDPPTCQAGPTLTCADDGDLCTTDVCSFLTGTCGVDVHCNFDGNPCTDDVCDPTTGTCYIPNSDPCHADNPCLDDVCDGTTGTCGVPNTDLCEDGDLCTVGDVCSAGACTPGTGLTCPDDGNPCTNDVCNPLYGTCGLPQVCACP